MKYAAVLFDLDGTLVDTIDLYGQAVMGALKQFNLQLTNENYVALYSKGSSVNDYIEHCGGDSMLETDVRTVRDELYHSLLRQHSEWLQGAPELLHGLKNAGTPTGIITGSWRSYVEAISEKTKVLEYTDVLITCDDVKERHKPDPYGLFLAAEKMGIDLKRSIYIGDQWFDVEAANAAGMTSCLIKTKYTPVYAEKDASHIINSLQDLQSIIA